MNSLRAGARSPSCGLRSLFHVGSRTEKPKNTCQNQDISGSKRSTLGIQEFWMYYIYIWSTSDCETLQTDCETSRTDCATRIVKLDSRIVKLAERIVKLVLWNFESGLWNSEIGLWNSEIGLWNCKARLWNCQIGTLQADWLWNSEGRLWNYDCETLKADCETTILKLKSRLWRSEEDAWCKCEERLWNSG